MNLHTGTHMDMPLHFIPGGDTVDMFDISRLVAACRVIDLIDVEFSIHAEDLLPFDIRKGETILFKTRNSLSEEFDFEFIYLASDGAEFLAAKSVNCVGIDSLGIERAQSDHSTHKTLLGAGITIIEGLRLKDVEQGSYELFAVPIKIAGAEAAPVRAFLMDR